MAQVIEKPVLPGRALGQIWGVFGTAAGGGLFLGFVVGGMVGDDLIEGAIAAGTLPLASLALLLQVRRRRPVPTAVLFFGLFLASWAGAFLVAFGAREAQDLRYMAQIRAWFGTAEAKAGVALLVAGLLVAVVLSIRRPEAGEGG